MPILQEFFFFPFFLNDMEGGKEKNTPLVNKLKIENWGGGAFTDVEWHSLSNDFIILVLLLFFL